MGAQGCAAGELDLGPSGGFRAGRGSAGQGWGLVPGGGATEAKSRATRDWGGGPSAVRPLHPTPRSATAPWTPLSPLQPPVWPRWSPGPQPQGRGRGGGREPVQIPLAAVGTRRGMGAPPRADKGTKKASLSKGARQGGEHRVWPSSAGTDWSPGQVSRVPLSCSVPLGALQLGAPPREGAIKDPWPCPGCADTELEVVPRAPGLGPFPHLTPRQALSGRDLWHPLPDAGIFDPQN
ncbi:hypothetical protein HJG60_012060 [Phyllostomus discolor]|uniref:Uncharacterized protein n=1 Tax=Phyllostomus discolor TaxID=89673 RepID=A0A833ZER1_9CHIR|nr:hypothetical protein HJG60_012060 [Phyllostomus discolor]